MGKLMGEFEYALFFESSDGPLRWGDWHPGTKGQTHWEEWICEAELDGINTDSFFIARRPLNGWERVE